MENFNIGVIGVGYVGLPLAMSLSKYFKVLAYDLDKSRINSLKKNKDLNNEEVLNIKKKNIKFTNNKKNLKDCNVYIITVPTPINKKNKPDIRHLISSTKIVSDYIKQNNLVIYESTVYPGLIEEISKRYLEKKKFKLNKNFILGYSPERINPGDKKRKIENINKLISASNEKGLNKMYKIYSSFIKAKVIKVSSIKVAEAAKVIENTQRDVNIALTNEFSLIFNKLGIDSDQVFTAASTKWNFIKEFRPGLVGGHCIGVDPYYLAEKAINIGLNPKLILAGRDLNNKMYRIIGNRILKIHFKKHKKKPNVLMLGITFKKNCSDIRNSQLIKLHSFLKKKSSKVYLFDKIAKIDKKNREKFSIKLSNNLNFINKVDIIVVGVNHKYTSSILKKFLKKIKNNAFVFQIEKAIDFKNKLEIYNI